jgi:alcohol dehydrogenase (cytochrome c)
MTGAHDPELGLVYWGTGNPAPIFNGDARAGDNLHTASVVALDLQSGKLRWHYQFTPNDEHDWDSTQQPVMADVTVGGQARAALLWANRNGFFYALDRRSGEFLYARPFVKQTWADGFDPRGRPIRREDARPSRAGTFAWPQMPGGTNWWPPSYDAQRRLMFVPTVDAASIYFRGEPVRKHGEEFRGGAALFATSQPAVSAIKAIDPSDGSIRWERRLESGGPEVRRAVGGVLSTATGIVFAGYRTDFFAFDAEDGAELWKVHLGGVVHAPPVAYQIDGVEYIAVVAGRALFVFSLPPPGAS